jgi:hypothetical protein
MHLSTDGPGLEPAPGKAGLPQSDFTESNYSDPFGFTSAGRLNRRRRTWPPSSARPGAVLASTGTWAFSLRGLADQAPYRRRRLFKCTQLRSRRLAGAHPRAEPNVARVILESQITLTPMAIHAQYRVWSQILWQFTVCQVIDQVRILNYFRVEHVVPSIYGRLGCPVLECR